MEFNKETFEKVLKAYKIARYQQHFEAVVKSYIEIENAALRIHDVVGRSEQLKAFREWTRENLDEQDIVTQQAVDSYLKSL